MLAGLFKFILNVELFNINGETKFKMVCKMMLNEV